MWSGRIAIEPAGMQAARAIVVADHDACSGCDCAHRLDLDAMRPNLDAAGKPLPGWRMVGPALMQRVGR
jgi:hypothetical protein